MVPNTALSMESDCAPLENVKVQFDSGHIVACESALSECYVVGQEERRTGSDAVDQELGVEKFEDRLFFRIFVHQIETWLGLREYDLHSYARDQI